MLKPLSALSLLLLAVPASYAADQLFPAGSIVTCMVAEGKISSKTTAVGDPVLCTLNPVEKYGRSTFPYGSYLEGRFEAYQDPGHFVGKGWMELHFDKLIMGNRVLPISAKVIQTPDYKVDRDGRIEGKGHATRDTVEWLIPVLWPIDLINLPRRGPSPVLKPESRLTLELMDDLGIADINDQPAQHQAALIERAPQPQQAPLIVQNFSQAPQQQAPAPQVVYKQAPPQTIVVQQQPTIVYRHAPPPPPVYYYPPGYRYYGPAY
jgi:hypothetical protein